MKSKDNQNGGEKKKVRLAVNINNRLTPWDIIKVLQAHYSTQEQQQPEILLFSQQMLERAEQTNTEPKLS